MSENVAGSPCRTDRPRRVAAPRLAPTGRRARATLVRPPVDPPPARDAGGAEPARRDAAPGSRRRPRRKPATKRPFWRRAADPDRRRAAADLPDPDVHREGLRDPVGLDGDDAARLHRLPERPGAGRQDHLPASRDPQPGDVVVFRGPDGWAQEFTAEEPTQRRRARRCRASARSSASPRRTRRTSSSGSSRSAARPSQCCDSRNRVLGRRQAAGRAVHLLPAPRRARPGRTRSGRSRCPRASCG